MLSILLTRPGHRLAATNAGGVLWLPIFALAVSFAAPLSLHSQLVQGLSTIGPAPYIDVTAYGTKADLRIRTTGCSMTSGSPTVTCPTGTFSQQDVGKAMTVENGLTASTDLNSTIASYDSTSNGQKVNLVANAGNSPSNMGVKWATDSAPAINGAIGAVGATGGTVFFPYNAAPGCTAATFLCNYYIASAITVSSSQPGIKLLGECGEPAIGNSVSSITAAANRATITSDRSTSPNTAMLVVGNPSSPTKFYSGLVVDNLGFRDISTWASTGTGLVQGAIDLVDTEDFLLQNVRIDNFSGASTNSGFGILFDGSGSTITNGDFTQFGVVINPNINNTTYPLQTRGPTSEINVFSGSVSCPINGNLVISGTIGVDLGKTYHNTSSQESMGGEWGVFGLHINHCSDGVSMYNMSTLNWQGVIEQTGSSFTANQGTGFVIDGNDSGGSNPPPQGINIRGLINNHAVGVNVPSGSTTINNSIEATISATTTPIQILASAAQSSTLLLISTDYGAGGSATVGSEFPTDLTLIPQSAPAAPTVTNSRRVYPNSTNGDLTSEPPAGGSTIDLENHGVSSQGDMLYANSASPPVLTRLALGTTGQCVTSNGTVPGWGSCSTTTAYDMTGLTATNTKNLTTNANVGHYTVNVDVEITSTETSGVTVQPSATCTGDGTARTRTANAINFSSTSLSSSVVFPCYADNSSTITVTATIAGGTLSTGVYAIHAWMVQQ